MAAAERKPSRLIDLPWEVHRPIIVYALRYGRKSVPSFNRKLIESRLRLRNCFDEHMPEVTNFYVPRYKNRYLHGNALRATNSQLRYETNLLIEEELKSGNINVPFVLDIMVVKDIGVFPTWMSFPYRPEHIKKMTVNVRIVRPGTSIVPNEWVEAATYQKQIYSGCETSPTRWHGFIMAVVLYAFGYFTTKPDPALPLINHKNQPTTALSVAVEEAQKHDEPIGKAKTKLSRRYHRNQ